MRQTLVLLTLFLAAMAARAQTSFPMITHTMPVAVQRGTTAEISVEGQMDFRGAYRMLVQGDGISAEVAPTPEPKSASSQTRLMKSSGVSTLGFSFSG